MLQDETKNLIAYHGYFPRLWVKKGRPHSFCMASSKKSHNKWDRLIDRLINSLIYLAFVIKRIIHLVLNHAMGLARACWDVQFPVEFWGKHPVESFGVYGCCLCATGSDSITKKGPTGLLRRYTGAQLEKSYSTCFAIVNYYWPSLGHPKYPKKAFIRLALNYGDYGASYRVRGSKSLKAKNYQQ